MLFGAEPSGVQAAVVRDAGRGVDVLTSGILEFEDGIATFTCSTRTETDQRVHIYGTSGRISIEIPFNIPPDRPTRIVVTRAAIRRSRPRPRRSRSTRPIRTRARPRRSRAAVLDGGRCRSRRRTRSPTCG